MTVNVTTAKAQYNGNGVTTAFTVPFRFLDNTHLRVICTSSAGVDTTLVLSTDYTVTGAGAATGTLTMLTAPASGEKLTIMRNMPFSQQIDLVNGDPLPAETLEAGLDARAMEAQQLKEAVARSLSLPLSSTASAVLPEALPLALIGWNSAANALQSFAGAAGTPVSSFMAPAVAAANATAAQTAIGGTTVGRAVFSAATAAAARTSLGAAASGANSDITSLLNSSGIQIAARVDIASAATVILTSAPDDLNITGTTSITGFTVQVGRVLRVRFAGSLTLTNGASLVTQSGANIVTQAGDTCILRATAANTVEVLSYARSLSASLGAFIVTTSGSTAQFTGIPSTAKRISAIFAGVSTAGVTNVGLQIGSGSFSTSGYNGAHSQLNGATGSSYNTSGMIPLDNAASAANVRSGRITLTRMGGNLWVWDGVVACAGSSIVEMTAGSIHLAGALDRVQLMMNGADTFDAGSFNILVE